MSFDRTTDQAAKTAVAVVKPEAFRSTSGFTHQMPFYDIWGNGIAAAALASEYSKRGFSVTSEEVLDFPSVGQDAVSYTHL